MSPLLALVTVLGFTSFTEPIHSDDVVLTRNEWCVARAVYFEGGSSKYPEPYVGLQLAAYVMKARGLEDLRMWGWYTGCGVVNKNAGGVYQFSAMANEKNRTARPGGWRWRQVVMATLSVYRYGWHPAIVFGGRWDEIRYYMRRSYSNPDNVRRFDAEFDYIGTVGHHEFFAPKEGFFDRLMSGLFEGPHVNQRVGFCAHEEREQAYTVMHQKARCVHRKAPKHEHHRRRRR